MKRLSPGSPWVKISSPLKKILAHKERNWNWLCLLLRKHSWPPGARKSSGDCNKNNSQTSWDSKSFWANATQKRSRFENSASSNFRPKQHNAGRPDPAGHQLLQEICHSFGGADPELAHFSEPRNIDMGQQLQYIVPSYSWLAQYLNISNIVQYYPISAVPRAFKIAWRELSKSLKESQRVM